MKKLFFFILIPTIFFTSCYEAPDVSTVVEENITSQWSKLSLNMSYSMSSQDELLNYAYDSEDNLYLLYSNGRVLMYDGNAISFYATFAGMSYEQIIGFFINSKDQLYIYSEDNLYRFEKTSDKFIKNYLSLVDTLGRTTPSTTSSITSIRKFVCDKDDNLYLNYNGKLYFESDFSHKYSENSDSINFISKMMNTNFSGAIDGVNSMFYAGGELLLQDKKNYLYNFKDGIFSRQSPMLTVLLNDVKSDGLGNIFYITSNNLYVSNSDRIVPKLDNSGLLVFSEDYRTNGFENIDFDTKGKLLVSTHDLLLHEEASTWKIYNYYTEENTGTVLRAKNNQIVIVSKTDLYVKSNL